MLSQGGTTSPTKDPRHGECQENALCVEKQKESSLALKVNVPLKVLDTT